MSKFSRWITPLDHHSIEPLYAGQSIEYEDFPCTIDVTGPLLYTLFQERWQDIQVGHVVEGSILELEFNQPPKICILYDGYLTVVTEAWHLHLCLEEHLGGPLQKTPPELRQQRSMSNFTQGTTPPDALAFPITQLPVPRIRDRFTPTPPPFLEIRAAS